MPPLLLCAENRRCRQPPSCALRPPRQGLLDAPTDFSPTPTIKCQDQTQTQSGVEKFFAQVREKSVKRRW